MSDKTPRKATDKEAMFFLIILGAMKNKPEVDWTLVANRAGYSNAACAKTRFGQIKRQIGYSDDGASVQTPPAKGNGSAKKEKVVGSGTIKNPSKVTKANKARPTPKKFIIKAPKDESSSDEGHENDANTDVNDGNDDETETEITSDAFEDAEEGDEA